MNQPLASIGQRFTSQFLDDLVALALGVGVFASARAVALPLELGLVAFAAYVVLCDGLPGGQSIGKRFTKTAVVSASTGKPCRYWQSLVRNAAMALSVVDAVFILGKQRRRLGDYIAGTKVVRLDLVA